MRFLAACLLPLCLAAAPLMAGAALAQSAGEEEEGPVLFEADTISAPENDGPIVAEGNVRAYFGDRQLVADKIIFDQTNDIITAIGNVSITDDVGNVYFADKIELTGDLRDGVATSFRALLAERARLAARYAVRREDSVNRLRKAVYSACEVCDEDGDRKRPTWRLKAFRVTQDTNKRVIRYRHAFLEIKGVPVFYMPYFQQPDPSVKRQSGFLAPKVGNSGELGNFAEVPYYLALSDHYDATLSPLFTARDGTLWKGEWRQRLRRGYYVVQGGGIYTDSPTATSTEPDKSTRWHYFGEGEYELPKRWRTGFDIARTSDATYIRRYDIEREGELRQEFAILTGNRLTSNVYATRNTQNSTMRVDSYLFQGLRRTDDSGKTPIVLPSVNYQKDLQTPFIGGRTSLKANALLLQRTAGTDTRRLSLSATWRKGHTTRQGHRISAFAEMRADGYYYEDLREGIESGALDTEDDSKFIGRALPTIGADWSWPLVRRGKNGSRQVIEPIVQLAVSPVGGNPSEIINEDSQSIEFDTGSLFEFNKSSGLDIWEDGQRANLGFRISSSWKNGLEVKAMVGQTYRLQETSGFGEATGLSTKRTDIVGEVEASLGSRLSVRNRFRLDEEDGSVRRNEVNVNGRIWRLSGSANYLRLEDENISQGILSREELRSNISLKLTRQWSAFGNFREDLDPTPLPGEPEKDRQTIDARFGLRYADECSDFTIAYRRDFTQNNDLQPNSTIFFTFTLRTLVE